MEAYVEPYDDRDERDPALPSLRSVADELNTTILRARKLLITAEFFSTSTSRTISQMVAAGKTDGEIKEQTGLSRASINSYPLYKGLAFNLDQTTVNADRHKLFRRRVKATAALQKAIEAGTDEELALWQAIIEFQGYPFQTSGRGGKGGVKFKYTVSRTGGVGGRHYDGETVDGYGNEMIIEG